MKFNVEFTRRATHFFLESRSKEKQRNPTISPSQRTSNGNSLKVNCQDLANRNQSKIENESHFIFYPREVTNLLFANAILKTEKVEFSETYCTLFSHLHQETESTKSGVKIKDILSHSIQWAHWIRLQLESKYGPDNWHMLEWKEKFKHSNKISKNITSKCVKSNLHWKYNV